MGYENGGNLMKCAACGYSDNLDNTLDQIDQQVENYCIKYNLKKDDSMVNNFKDSLFDLFQQASFDLKKYGKFKIIEWKESVSRFELSYMNYFNPEEDYYTNLFMCPKCKTVRFEEVNQ